MKRAALRGLLLTCAVAGLAGCANLQPKEAKPAPVTPQITEQVLRERAREQFALGVRQYDAGDFDNALKNLNAALDHGLLSKSDQSNARKHLAFIHCASNREAQCRDEFRKAFEIDPDFSLNTAEDGHPIWGPVYRNVRTQLITEREAARAKPLIPLSKAEQLLSDGMVKYDSGDYVEAQKLLEAATKEGLKDKADQVRALKHAAFCLCLQGKYAVCRATFVKIYDVDPDFDLLPAEAGHPQWTRTFAGAKAQAKKAIADKALAEKAAKDKALAEKAAKEKAAQQKPAAAAPAAAARDKAPAPASAAPVQSPPKTEPPKKN